MNYLEIIGTLIGLLYLWLEYRASIYLWIAGIIMPASIFLCITEPDYTPILVSISIIFSQRFMAGWYGSTAIRRTKKQSYPSRIFR